MPGEEGKSRAKERAPGKPLNLRQARFLEIVYKQDQEAEALQNRKWRDARHREPAGQWRWIPYAALKPQADPTIIQRSLAEAGIRGAGAGATLSALARRGLIEFRVVIVETIHGSIRQKQVRITRIGRRAARSNLPPESPTKPRLAPWLENALIEIRDAPFPGLPKTRISRKTARVLGPAGYHYIDDQNEWSYKIANKGLDYLDHRHDDRQAPADAQD